MNIIDTTFLFKEKNREYEEAVKILLNNEVRGDEKNKAAECIFNLLDKAPDNPHYLYVAGKIFSHKGYIGYSFNKAIECYEKAAEKGCAEAMNELGWIFHDAKAFEKAFYWFSRSVETGNIEGTLFLGRAYMFGEGTSKNTEKAEALLTSAYNSGNKDAGYFLQRLLTNNDDITEVSKSEKIKRAHMIREHLVSSPNDLSAPIKECLYILLLTYFGDALEKFGVPHDYKKGIDLIKKLVGKENLELYGIDV